MVQTAYEFSPEQSLYIAQDEPIINTNSAEATPKTTSSTFFVEQGVFNYGDRARFNFQLSASYSSYFSLIRGLIEFNRGKDLTFTYHRDTNSFETDIEAGHHTSLNELLVLVHDELSREIRFKQKLKEVIRFEARYKAKMARMYATFL